MDNYLVRAGCHQLPGDQRPDSISSFFTSPCPPDSEKIE